MKYIPSKERKKIQAIKHPTRTKQEWREITRIKLKQYEAIGYVIMGKLSKVGGE